MANPLENDCENANKHTHGGVGTFTKEKKLELMWINSVKKRVQNFTGGVSARRVRTVR